MKFYIFLPFARKQVVKRLRFRTLKSRNFFENIMLMDWGSFKLISFPSCACCSAARCSARFQILAGNLGERAGIQVTWFLTRSIHARSQSPLRSLDHKVLKSFFAVWDNVIVTQYILLCVLPVRRLFFILIESHSEQKRRFIIKTAWPAFYLDLCTTGLLNRTKFNFNRLIFYLKRRKNRNFSLPLQLSPSSPPQQRPFLVRVNWVLSILLPYMDDDWGGFTSSRCWIPKVSCFCLFLAFKMPVSTFCWARMLDHTSRKLFASFNSLFVWLLGVSFVIASA